MAKDSSLAGSSVYRLFRLDMNGRILGSEVLDAVDDLDALGLARDKIDRFGVELWDRDRLIARLMPGASE